ncbi:MAG: hypothetical protein E7812_14930 [Phenylobacterium sp.]|nr:MAG: hypothetical protein E7812_14930 [Phenylobacterium sp.]
MRPPPKVWIGVGGSVAYWLAVAGLAAFNYQLAFDKILGRGGAIHGPSQPGSAGRPLTLDLAHAAGMNRAGLTVAAAAPIFLCLVLMAFLVRPARPSDDDPEAASEPAPGDNPDPRRQHPR